MTSLRDAIEAYEQYNDDDVDAFIEDWENKLSANHYPADFSAVDYLLAHPVGNDGRSEWRWFHLPNGDVVLGFFPTGDAGYEGTAIQRQIDFERSTHGTT